MYRYALKSSESVLQMEYAFCYLYVNLNVQIYDQLVDIIAIHDFGTGVDYVLWYFSSY